MNFKKIEKNGYNLHLIKNKNFKTIIVKIMIWNNIKKEDLVYRNMLMKNLLFSSKKYNTNRKMSIQKEELYGAEIMGETYRKGTQIITEFSLLTIEDKYTEQGNFKKSLEFLFECLNNPNIKNNKFDETSFKIIKEEIKSQIKNEKENPSLQSYKKYKELIGKDKVFTGTVLGSIKDLNKVTEENLYKYYKNFFNNNHIDIVILGNINNSIEKEIEKYINLKPKNIPYEKISSDYETEFKEKEESSRFNQSKLIMGSSIKSLTEKEKKYDLIIYNIILGSSPTSKLFQNVREKSSLAYSISSSVNRLDGMFIIHAGISSKNYKKTKEEILKQIENMKKGDFKEEEIHDAKEVVLSIIKEINDSPWSIIDHYINNIYFGAEPLKIQKERVMSITKANILNVANKINIDTIFLLKEDQNEKI